MSGVCIMLDKKPKKGTDDYWASACKELNKPSKFLTRLEKYNKNGISEKVIQKMTKFLDKYKADFVPEVMKKASSACEGVTKWCLAIYEYHFVYKEITPLRANLAKAEKTHRSAQEDLRIKQAELEEVK